MANLQRGLQYGTTGAAVGAPFGPWGAGVGGGLGLLYGLFSGDDGSQERQRGAQEAMRQTEQFARQQRAQREEDLKRALGFFQPAAAQMERLYGMKMPDPMGAHSQIGRRTGGGPAQVPPSHQQVIDLLGNPGGDGAPVPGRAFGPGAEKITNAPVQGMPPPRRPVVASGRVVQPPSTPMRRGYTR